MIDILKRLQIIESDEYKLSDNTEKDLVFWNTTLYKMPKEIREYLALQSTYITESDDQEYYSPSHLKFLRELHNFTFLTAFFVVLLGEIWRIRSFLAEICRVTKQYPNGNVSFELMFSHNDDYGVHERSYKLIENFGGLLSEKERNVLIERVSAIGMLNGFIAEIDENGLFKLNTPHLIQKLSGVNVTRIRICEVCSKFFWASRKDAFACSKLHAKTRQMRLLRANWAEKGELYVKERNKKQNKKESK